MGGKDQRVTVKSRNMYKGPMDKDNGVGIDFWERRWDGTEGNNWEKNGDNCN